MKIALILAAAGLPAFAAASSFSLVCEGRFHTPQFTRYVFQLNATPTGGVSPVSGTVVEYRNRFSYPGNVSGTLTMAPRRAEYVLSFAPVSMGSGEAKIHFEAGAPDGIGLFRIGAHSNVEQFICSYGQPL